MKCPECSHQNPPKLINCENCRTRLYLARLRITLASGRDQTHYLFPQNYKIGRGAEQDIVIEDFSVSRDHVEISYDDCTFSILDKDSKNGSFINNEHFQRHQLRDMDCIQIGNVTMHFYEEKKETLGRSGQFSTEEYVQREFIKIAQERQTIISTQALLNTMLDLTLSLIHAESAFLFQFNETGDLEFRVVRGDTGRLISENPLADSEWHIIDQAIKVKETQIIPNGADHSFNANWEKIVVPLIANEFDEVGIDSLVSAGVLGACYFLSGAQSNPISKRKQELLRVITLQISMAIENEILYNEAREKRKISRELAFAREIQQRLHSTTPQINNLEIAAFVNPYQEVSGDYFDIIPISANTVGIAIGDVCGKGVPAALLASTVQAAIRSQLEYSTSPTQIICNLNRLLIESTADAMFVTLFFGILEIGSGIFKYVNAGHPPPILIKKNRELEELSATTLALGILESEPDSERSTKFRAGDIIIIYTDGVIESKNNEKNIYGRQRLLRRVQSIIKGQNEKGNKLESIIEDVVEDLSRFIGDSKQTDDLTLLAIKSKESDLE